MPFLLFKLNGVPEDEADDVRELLGRQHIDFYETSAGRWGISVAAIWLRDEDEGRLHTAQQLIEDYQDERMRNARAAYATEQREGRAETLAERLRREPLRLLAYALAVLAILYLSIMPFLHLR